MTKTLLSVFGVAAFSSGVFAAAVIPAGYTFNQHTDAGLYDYRDNTGEQLIDGIFGVAPWFADLGNGPAYEWVGWTDSQVNIDFSFGSIQNISQINIGTVQDVIIDVVWPSVQIFASADGINYGSSIYTLLVPASSDNDNQHTIYDITGLNINAPYVRVTLNSQGPYMFTDEIQFFGAPATSPTQNVPDTSSAGWLLGASLLMLGGLRKRAGAVS